MTARCDRALGIEINDYLDQPTAERWREFADHLSDCSVCAAEIRAWDALRTTQDSEDHPHEDVLLDYVDDRNTLEAQTIERVKSHLSLCASCRDEVAVLSKVHIEPAGESADAHSPFAGLIADFFGRLRSVVWNPAFAYVLVAVLLVPTLSRLGNDESVIVRSPVPILQSDQVGVQTEVFTESVRAPEGRLRALGYMDGGEESTLESLNDVTQGEGARGEVAQDEVARSDAAQVEVVQRAAAQSEVGQSGDSGESGAARSVASVAADESAGADVGRVRRSVEAHARRSTYASSRLQHRPWRESDIASSLRSAPEALRESEIQKLVPGEALTISAAEARGGLTFHFNVARADRKQDDSNLSVATFIVPATIRNVEGRIVGIDGDRQIRYRGFAVPNDPTSIVSKMIRVPGAWLRPGSYRVTVHAEDSEAALGAPFSIEVTP
jgi:hypothetical protein